MSLVFIMTASLGLDLIIVVSSSRMSLLSRKQCDAKKSQIVFLKLKRGMTPLLQNQTTIALHLLTTRRILEQVLLQNKSLKLILFAVSNFVCDQQIGVTICKSVILPPSAPARLENDRTNPPASLPGRSCRLAPTYDEIVPC